MTGPTRDVYVSTACQDGSHTRCPVLRKTNRVRCSCSECDHSRAAGPPATMEGEEVPSRWGYDWYGQVGLRHDLVRVVEQILPHWLPHRWRHHIAIDAVYVVLRRQGSIPPVGSAGIERRDEVE